MQIDNFESQIFEKMSEVATADDPAHDILHFKRVVKIAKQICKMEGGEVAVVVPAAWLHDFVIVPKDSPLRSRASTMSAEGAIQFLKSIGYPSQYFDQIAHAVAAHSFSAQIYPETLEAKIVQDADRLDSLGAIGIARCFATAGLMKRPFYSEDDPLCESRQPNDQANTLDHFFVKLFRIAETLQTKAGRAEGLKRLNFMREFIVQLSQEMR